MYANVRGLKGKLTSMRQILQENTPHLFLTTETHLRSNAGIEIEGYTFLGRKREGKTGGGVAIFVRNDIKSNVTAHVPERNIEMLWVGIQRKNMTPFMVGVYYGKQEVRTSKDEIEREMTLLQEHIAEMQQDGPVLLAMDGNGKIGLLGEPISRNGKLLLQAFESTDLTVVNSTQKCLGVITRQNTKKNSRKISH